MQEEEGGGGGGVEFSMEEEFLPAVLNTLYRCFYCLSRFAFD